MLTDSTRLKYGLLFVGIVFLEGLVTSVLHNFPFIAAVTAQGMALGFYTGGKTWENIAKIGPGGNGGTKP